MPIFKSILQIFTILILTSTIKIKAAEKVEKSKFIISIIDTGIDLSNEDLKKQLWQNIGETGLDSQGKNKSTNGLDDDQNGYVDDLYGWNFFNNSNQLQDNHGHGTHIAGIIYNELKKLKIENHFSFQILKYYDSDRPSTGLIQASNRSLQYALNNNSQLINYSGGGYEPNKDEQKWIQKLQEKNIPLVAALGNQSLNTDLNPFFPASYHLENIFAIGAAQKNQKAATFSNYGKTLDFLTPGVEIKSEGLNKTKALLSGTSQSTATATALIAYMIFQQTPTNWKNIKETLKSLRQITTQKQKTENPIYLDTTYIQKHKTTATTAFGESTY